MFALLWCLPNKLDCGGLLDLVGGQAFQPCSVMCLAEIVSDHFSNRVTDWFSNAVLWLLVGCSLRVLAR